MNAAPGPVVVTRAEGADGPLSREHALGDVRPDPGDVADQVAVGQVN